MEFIGGAEGAVQLLTELEESGKLILLRPNDCLVKINNPNASAKNSTVNQGIILLIHLDFKNKSTTDRFLNIYPPLSSPILSKRCVFLILNLTLRRVLCVGVDGADVFLYDTSEGKFHTALLDVDRIELFLQSDGLNQVQKLFDGLSEYAKSLCEYNSLYRFPEDEVFTALENTADDRDDSVVEIEGNSLTRGELIEYEKMISENAVRMNMACKKIEFFFPDFDFSDLNMTER